LFRFETKVTITRFVCAFIIKYNSNYIRFRFIVVQFCLSREKEEEKKRKFFVLLNAPFEIAPNKNDQADTVTTVTMYCLQSLLLLEICKLQRHKYRVKIYILYTNIFLSKVDNNKKVEKILSPRYTQCEMNAE